MLVRDDPGGPALAPGGTLGGSQAGARISYRLGGGLALSGRLYLPLRRPAGAEAAAGLDWRPVASIPVNLLAERRQALGGEGRSAFALTLYGGVALALPRGLRLDVYGQAGVVGIKSARPVRRRRGRACPRRSARSRSALGARGAAQPGAARLDAGPGLSYRLPLRGANVRLAGRLALPRRRRRRAGLRPRAHLAADFRLARAPRRASARPSPLLSGPPACPRRAAFRAP